jgi:hypothetical protein
VALLVTRRRHAHSFLAAGAWFVALLLPVLPLRQHTYAYYSYAAQAGFLILAAEGILRLGTRLGSALGTRRGERGPVGIRSQLLQLGLCASAVSASVLLAARNARTHERLTLPKSSVPHDPIVRYARAGGAIVHAVGEPKLPPEVKRVAFMSFPEELGTAAQTPGTQRPGMVRVRKSTLRESMRGGKLVTLHFPGLAAVWIDSLTTELEGPDTAIFFASGNDVVARVPHAPQAYLLQAEGRFLVQDRAGARRGLERALQIAPDFSAARVLLAGIELETGRARAVQLLRGLAPDSVPKELRPYHAELRKTLGLDASGTDSSSAPAAGTP